MKRTLRGLYGVRSSARSGFPAKPRHGAMSQRRSQNGKIAYKHKNGTVYDMTPLPLPFKLAYRARRTHDNQGRSRFPGCAVDNYSGLTT